MAKTGNAALLRFRVMAIVCGVNLLLLILGYMPAKYIFDALESNSRHNLEYLRRIWTTG